jgi:DNA-binding IclR family transcriptional regulator
VLSQDAHVREPTGLIGSAQRALRVLEVVAAAGDALTAKAVARRAGYKLSTTYHLLNTLAHEGYLERVGHGQGFRLGAKIGSMQSSGPRHDDPCLACGFVPVHGEARPTA